MSALTSPPVPTPVHEATRADLLERLLVEACDVIATLAAEKAAAEARERDAVARAERAEKRIGSLEALVDRLDDEGLAIIQGPNRYSAPPEWMEGADHGAKHVACDVRAIIRAGDPELDDRAIRRAALTRSEPATTTTEGSEHADRT